MPIVSPGQKYTATIRSDDGVEVLHGQFSELMTMIPGSTARMDAEQAITLARMTEARNKLTEIRNDDLDKRETELKAQENAMLVDMARRLSDGVEAISRRLDALAERRAQEATEAEIRAADQALAVLRAGDDGDLESPKSAPEIEDKERAAALSAEEAIAKSKDDDQGEFGDPTLPASDPRIFPSEPSAPGGLPRSLATDDSLRYGRTFICARDRRAARKQLRQSQMGR
jgi:hypothetical protein